MNGHVLGLDLSLTSTGWATVDETGGHECEVVRTTADCGLQVRLDAIVTAALEHAEAAGLVVVEKPYNARFGNDGAIVYGAVLHALYGLHNLRTVTVPPVSLKVFACGTGASGGGSKIGPAIEAAKRLGYQGANDNEVDALWLATLGWHLLGAPVVDLPQTHTRALAANWAKGWPGHLAPVAKPRRKKAESGKGGGPIAPHPNEAVTA